MTDDLPPVDMSQLGEDVPPPPAMTQTANLILELVRDTLLVPKPIGREQIALEIYKQLAPTVVERAKGWKRVANESVKAADALLAALAKPSAE